MRKTRLRRFKEGKGQIMKPAIEIQQNCNIFKVADPGVAPPLCCQFWAVRRQALANAASEPALNIMHVMRT